MSVSRLRFLQWISTLNTINSSSTARFIVTQKHSFFGNTVPLRPWTHSIPLTKHQSSSFATQSKDDADDSDSDFSDFSDFSDSDDSDSDDIDVLSTNKGGGKSTAKRDVLSSSSSSSMGEGQLMKDRLIISNLNFSTNRNDLWELCEHYGTVTDVHLPANRNRDFHNRGFGFVTFENEDDAQKALDAVAGTMFNSRQLRAGFARAESAERQRFSNDPAMDRMPGDWS